jgi:hypothetical protein
MSRRVEWRLYACILRRRVSQSGRSATIGIVHVGALGRGSGYLTRTRTGNAGFEIREHFDRGKSSTVSVGRLTSIAPQPAQSNMHPMGVSALSRRVSNETTDFASSPRRALCRACRSHPRRTASRVHISGGVTSYLALTPILRITGLGVSFGVSFSADPLRSLGGQGRAEPSPR